MSRKIYNTKRRYDFMASDTVYYRDNDRKWKRAVVLAVVKPGVDVFEIVKECGCKLSSQARPVKVSDVLRWIVYDAECGDACVREKYHIRDATEQDGNRELLTRAERVAAERRLREELARRAGMGQFLRYPGEASCAMGAVKW